MKKLVLVSILAGLAPFAASAATATANFTVSLTIQSTCSVTTAPTNVSLARVKSTSSADATGSSSFSVTCSKGTPFNVGLQTSTDTAGAGNGTGTLVGTGTNNETIPYALFQDAGFATAWGNTATATTVGNGVAGAANTDGTTARAFTVYVKALGTNINNKKPDTYKDRVTVNVQY